MKMANSSLAVVVIFLAGTVSAAVSHCGFTRCPVVIIPPGLGIRDAVCRYERQFVNCLRSEIKKGCNDSVLLVQQAIRRSEELLQHHGCGTVSLSQRPCGFSNCPIAASTTKAAACSNERQFMNCLRSEINKGCDDMLIRMQEAINNSQELVKDCDNAAAGQVSSMLMCLGLASLAHFISKFL